MTAEAQARQVRQAQRRLQDAASDQRRQALERLAELLESESETVQTANRRDLEAAENLAPELFKRLALTADKIATLAEGCRQLARRPDPINEVIVRRELDEGLLLTQVRSPLPVVLVIFESRPDALIQIAALALRAGVGLLLKGGAEAKFSCRALLALVHQALGEADLPQEVIALVEGREAAQQLLGCSDTIDLVIPRGSGELVRAIQASTQIPVLGHAEGICHLYLHAAADPTRARHLALDGKCDAPSTCNATETLLLDRAFLPHWPELAQSLSERGVKLLADERARESFPAAEAAPADWHTEWGDLRLAVRVVDDLEAAIDHIHRFGSGHTEAICTEDEKAAREFLRRVDAASVFWNASTRFADGYRYGLGAEVGIATGRLHARGPVGIEGLMTTRWLLEGQGQGAGDYGPGKRRFRHESAATD